MPEMTTTATAELTNLEERIKKLPANKASPRLIIHLMNKLNTVLGLDYMVETILKTLSDASGGVNLSRSSPCCPSMYPVPT